MKKLSPDAGAKQPSDEDVLELLTRIESLAEYLARNNCYWAAKAFRAYLDSPHITLDEAFGLAPLRRPRGRPADTDKNIRTVRAALAKMNASNKSAAEIDDIQRPLKQDIDVKNECDLVSKYVNHAEKKLGVQFSDVMTSDEVQSVKDRFEKDFDPKTLPTLSLDRSRPAQIRKPRIK